MYKTQNARDIISEVGECIQALSWMGEIVTQETQNAQDLVNQGLMTTYEANQRLLERGVDKLIEDQNTLIQRMNQ